MGSAPSSAPMGPFKDESWKTFQQGPNQNYPLPKHIAEKWEIWGCSPGLFAYQGRCTRWFEVHRWEPGQTWFSPEYCEYLKNFDGPVFTGAPVPEIKNCVVYPLKEVEAEFSAFFLNSSLSLMAALAIMEIEKIRASRASHRAKGDGQGKLPEGLWPELQLDDSDDVIGFFGVDMSATEEYSRQKPGCWFFGLEILRRGIQLYYPPESDLFYPEPVYGISEWDNDYIKSTARMREINARLDANQQQLQKVQQQCYADAGAKDNMSYYIKTFMAKHYALPAGTYIKHTPGTGLGLGVVDKPHDDPNQPR